jgi:hypothetical protein
MKIGRFRLAAINFPTIAIAQKPSTNQVKMPETYASHLVNPVNRQFLKILLKFQPSAFIYSPHIPHPTSHIPHPTPFSLFPSAQFIIDNSRSPLP